MLTCRKAGGVQKQEGKRTGNVRFPGGNMAELILNEKTELPIFLEDENDTGLLRIAEKVLADLRRTTRADGSVMPVSGSAEQAVIVLQDSDSAPARAVRERIPELNALRGKWETYGFYLAEHPLPQIDQGLVIYGSDRLGTIYGMFHLSELLGVTAMEYWGDVMPVQRENVRLVSSRTESSESALSKTVSAEAASDRNREPQGKIETVIPVSGFCSKEPSVKYRGFFINDEWPCFGEWTFSHFSGFTAEMYDHVFELLLRMKGNYLWPAMWTSSFLLDGPGMKSMELADAYGIYIGMSHHEPCMRSSEEWDLLKGEDGPYGTEWDYRTNREGLLRYWSDALIRAKGHQVFPTLGMRGERDSKLLEDEAGINENVRLLKDVITEQRKLIRTCLNPDLKQVPQLFAVYKEVEDYYFGDGRTEGIRGFSELEDVTLLLCEDNFGNMRALPDEEMRNHPGGFGMYYHLDYHGAPCSYEWVNSTPLSRIWEQMTEAYEYGIRELWIVNVGDLKFQEYPLNYFLDLAYDFETWGSERHDSAQEYAKQWVRSQFRASVSEQQCGEIQTVLTETAELNGLRRPESLNDRIYHPVHHLEGRRMLERCTRLEQKNEELKKALSGSEAESGYQSMIYYPAAASANLVKMHLYSALNHLYAEQGKAAANEYGALADECVEQDAVLARQFSESFGGKWSGMAQALHIGFRSWNSEDWRYPVRHLVRLPKEKRLVVSRADSERYFTNQYFPVPLEIDDFSREGTDSVILQIADGGQEPLSWKIEETCEFLEFSGTEGTTSGEQEIEIRFLRERCPEGLQEFEFRIRSGGEFVPVHVTAQVQNRRGIPEQTFLPGREGYVIPADQFAERHGVRRDAAEITFAVLEHYGKFGSGMKAVPVTESFGPEEVCPSLTYRIWTDQPQSCVLELHSSPANPLRYGGVLTWGISVNDADRQFISAADQNYRGGDHSCAAWAETVLNQEHVCRMETELKQGLNTVAVFAQEAGIVLEQLRIYPKEIPMAESYLGPAVNART